MKCDIDWLIDTLKRGRKMLAKLRDDAPSGKCHPIRAAICQVDAAVLIAETIKKGEAVFENGK